MSNCPSGSVKWELNVGNIRILADNVRPGSRTVVRLGLRLKRQHAVGGLGMPRLLAHEAAVGRGTGTTPSCIRSGRRARTRTCAQSAVNRIDRATCSSSKCRRGRIGSGVDATVALGGRVSCDKEEADGVEASSLHPSEQQEQGSQDSREPSASSLEPRGQVHVVHLRRDLRRAQDSKLRRRARQGAGKFALSSDSSSRVQRRSKSTKQFKAPC